MSLKVQPGSGSAGALAAEGMRTTVAQTVSCIRGSVSGECCSGNSQTIETVNGVTLNDGLPVLEKLLLATSPFRFQYRELFGRDK